MLKVQEFLKSRSLESLESCLGITNNKHPDGRVILNYCQIESPKLDPIVRECRGLVLGPNFELVAKGFDRFFNLGEAPDLQSNFNWNSLFWTEEKVDGSIIFVYSYCGKLCINTRNSFGEGQINDSEWTWNKLVLSVLPQRAINYVLQNEGATLVLELCSPYNKVVRTYASPKLYLLTVFDEYWELSLYHTKLLADQLGLEKPKLHHFGSKEQVLGYIEGLEKDDPTNEGVVLRDYKNVRIKVKTKTWYALSALKDNGNLFSHRRLIPLILKNEHEEALCYFPELQAKVQPLVRFIDNSLVAIDLVWEQTKNIGPQKDFALTVLPYWYSAILFKARKANCHPKDLIQEFSDLFIKIWEYKK